jgi:ribosome-associated protein
VDDELRVNRTLRIPPDELEWRFSPSGGPGGQHANRSNTRVELRFDAEASPSLGPRQRTRIIERLGPVVRVIVDAERSQLRNRVIAQERLAERLRAALHIEKPRRPTRPTEAAKRRRMDAKRRLGEKKRQRRPPSRSDD